MGKQVWEAEPFLQGGRVGGATGCAPGCASWSTPKTPAPRSVGDAPPPPSSCTCTFGFQASEAGNQAPLSSLS